jgi:small-conductance mechanosensitive channel
MERLKELIKAARPILDYKLFELGDASFTLGSILYFLISIYVLFWVAGKVRSFLANRILTRYNYDVGVRQSIAAIIKYLILAIGLLVIFQNSGLNMSSLGLLAGALGVGIGLGLQTITNNFVSGIIIMFERPVKIGDKIEVGDVTGNVVHIGARATTVLTNDNISVIVPNSEFVSSKVVNWSHSERKVRFNFDVFTSYREDPELIKRLLLEVANENNAVLKDPAPDILFVEYGESTLKFYMRIWTTVYVDRPVVLKSQLYYAIFKKFKEHRVEIPYPQMELHMRSGGIGDQGKKEEKSADRGSRSTDT